MHTNIASLTTPSPAQTAAQQADAAQYATTAEAKGANTMQIAALADVAVDSHIAAHIRGVAASTVAHVSMHATATARQDTDRWHQWALSVADGLDQSALAASPLHTQTQKQ